eukprot:TRINITY_DN7763_c0_g2_i1.p1 TRINITY_DN7763_c0_g2~~TRINITY_DN7763_c0_g2_i1.p1  ORF type:complete len:438 (+),score=59.13 TRINITY_DN7763_c0_g2_i1:151-1464(+)
MENPVVCVNSLPFAQSHDGYPPLPIPTAHARLVKKVGRLTIDVDVIEPTCAPSQARLSPLRAPQAASHGPEPHANIHAMMASMHSSSVTPPSRNAFSSQQDMFALAEQRGILRQPSSAETRPALRQTTASVPVNPTNLLTTPLPSWGRHSAHAMPSSSGPHSPSSMSQASSTASASYSPLLQPQNATSSSASPRKGKRRSSFTLSQETAEQIAEMQTHAYHQRRASVCSNTSIDLTPIVPQMKDPLTKTPPPDHVATTPMMVNPFDDADDSPGSSPPSSTQAQSPPRQRTRSPPQEAVRPRRRSSIQHSRRASTTLMPVAEHDPVLPARHSPPHGDILEIAAELEGFTSQRKRHRSSLAEDDMFNCLEESIAELTQDDTAMATLQHHSEQMFPANSPHGSLGFDLSDPSALPDIDDMFLGGDSHTIGSELDFAAFHL